MQVLVVLFKVKSMQMLNNCLALENLTMNSHNLYREIIGGKKSLGFIMEPIEPI